MIRSEIKDKTVFHGRTADKKAARLPPIKGGPVMYEQLGFKVKIIGYLGNYLGIIQREDGSSFFVTHSTGKRFTHRGTARNSVRTVLKWHLKFGGWRLPKFRGLPVIPPEKESGAGPQPRGNKPAVRSQSTAPTKG